MIKITSSKRRRHPVQQWQWRNGWWYCNGWWYEGRQSRDLLSGDFPLQFQCNISCVNAKHISTAMPCNALQCNVQCVNAKHIWSGVRWCSHTILCDTTGILDRSILSTRSSENFTISILLKQILRSFMEIHKLQLKWAPESMTGGSMKYERWATCLVEQQEKLPGLKPQWRKAHIWERGNNGASSVEWRESFTATLSYSSALFHYDDT